MQHCFFLQEQQEEFQSEALNTIAAQQIGAITKMKKWVSNHVLLVFFDSNHTYTN